MVGKLKAVCFFMLILLLSVFGTKDAKPAQRPAAGLRHIYLDAVNGKDLRGRGTKAYPLKSISAALALVPDPVTEHISIHVAPGNYSTTGGNDMTPGTLELQRRMRARKAVSIVGEKEDFSKPADLGTVVFDWEISGDYPYLVMVTQGNWHIENIQLGTRKPRQRQGFSVTGPGALTLRNVRIHTRSFSGAALHAHRAGRIELAGTIEINEDLHDHRIEWVDGTRRVPTTEESFAGIIAEDHGSVKFIETKGASLSIGNGSLSASYYGVIQLGCQWAKITSWGRQSNNIAVNNSGRVDFHGTQTTLVAQQTENTPIGLEDDGHVLAEGAHIIIRAKEGQNAIVLQKASMLFCNDMEIQGKPSAAVVAYSGSVFVGGFIGDLGRTVATTGAIIHVAKCTGQLLGPFEATRWGRIGLSDGRQFPSLKP